MSASSVLLVAASIVAVDGGVASIDAGKTQHLEPGDHGQAFYELTVNGTPKRIEVGPVVVADVEDTSATVTGEPEAPLRPGYRVELRLPVERVPEPPVPAPAIPISEPAVLAPEPTADVPDPEHVALPVPMPSPVEPLKRPVSVPAVLTISAGRYLIGLDPPDADFFSQTPLHEVFLEAFEIDPSIVTDNDGAPLTGLSYAAALQHCQDHGLRLPTEEEWEVAVQSPGFKTQSDLYEWTASWYQPYPGNLRHEDAFGSSNRVLRSLGDGSATSLRARQFISPDQGSPQVGFRCVGDPE